HLGNYSCHADGFPQLSQTHTLLVQVEVSPVSPQSPQSEVSPVSPQSPQSEVSPVSPQSSQSEVSPVSHQSSQSEVSPVSPQSSQSDCPCLHPGPSPRKHVAFAPPQCRVGPLFPRCLLHRALSLLTVPPSHPCLNRLKCPHSPSAHCSTSQSSTSDE
ncbi:unnamed protein product, partial [Arctogadus glacialis]